MKIGVLFLRLGYVIAALPLATVILVLFVYLILTLYNYSQLYQEYKDRTMGLNLSFLQEMKGLSGPSAAARQARGPSAVDGRQGAKRRGTLALRGYYPWIILTQF